MVGLGLLLLFLWPQRSPTPAPPLCCLQFGRRILHLPGAFGRVGERERGIGITLVPCGEKSL